MSLVKYPRTRHLEGSRLQPGDDGGDQTPFRTLVGRRLVVEEKLDGANSAISFDAEGGLRLQSRGHFLQGGGRERQFSLLKTWAAAHAEALYCALKDRYIMYGEWMFAKHTVFYDALPHIFMEFDVYDRANACFLSTDARRAVLAGLPVQPVPVLADQSFRKLGDLLDLVRPSLYKTADWRDALAAAASEAGVEPERAATETDRSELSEGLYIKIEKDGVVEDRLKWVRADFLQAILDSGSHWMARPIIPNRLAPDIDLFAPRLGGVGAYDVEDGDAAS